MIIPGIQAAAATIGARSMVHSRATVLWYSAIFAAWGAIVAVGQLHHAFWRDEVRALSLALDADNLLSIPATIHGEGHPALWYLLLRAFYDIFNTQAVLPLVSILIAAAAVIIFLWQAPFSTWWKALFVLSAIPAYEYSVMARNYGIAMLLMFMYAAVYTGQRRSPFWLSLILFLLAQTNVIANLLIPFYLFIWLSDWWRARQIGLVPADRLLWIFFAAVISFAGMLAAFATVYPTSHDLMLSTYPDNLLEILSGMGSAILQPGRFYCGPPISVWGPICPTGGPLAQTVTTAVLYFAVAGLAVRVPLLVSALGGLWATTLFFRFVYPGDYRHQAIWVVFLITLYWFEFARQSRSPQEASRSIKFRLFLLSFYGVLATTLVLHTGIRKVYSDIATEISKSRAVGNLLQTTELKKAVILAEPEQIAEAIPYYADDDIYLLREGKFGKVATWSSHTSVLNLTLDDILVTARDLKNKTGRPVLILLEYPVTVIEPRQIREFASTFTGMWRFRYDGDEARAFLAATRKLPLGPRARLEDFDAYLLR
jgi:hypothetical protein